MTLKSVLIIAVSIILFSSCKGKSKSIKVGYLPIAECLPLYVAKEKGFFEKYGLEVELVSEPNGPTVFKELDAGAIDIGFSNVVTLIKQTNAGKSYKSIFGATYETINNTNHAIFGRTNDKIDFDKAIFGINAHKNIEELMLLSFLNSKGYIIDSSIQSRFKEIPFPQMLSSLKDKEIDYACIVEPGITIAKNDTSKYSYVGNHYSVDSNNKVLVATYVSTAKKISDNPKEIKKFIQAMQEATDYINNGNNDTRNFILTYSKLPENLLNKISLSEFSTMIDEKEFNKIIDLMYNPSLNVNNSFISNPSKKVDYNSIIFNQK
ncbi:MAG TPA: ABC transporter substrate-binding protein [Chitinophagaceae bacterium]|nr:ABC transporter substrate-binding protein [Chitinophagaceae bacterium]